MTSDSAVNEHVCDQPGSGDSRPSWDDAAPEQQPSDTGGRRRALLGRTACWLALAPVLVGTGLRLAGPERGHLIQVVAFTPYLVPAVVLPLVLALALRRWWTAGVAALTAALLVTIVAPRALPDHQPTTTGPELQVLTANLWGGNGDPAALTELVRQHRVDVLALQEFTPHAQAALEQAGLAALLPYRQLNAVRGTSGSALYSRLPLTDGGVRGNGGGFTQAYATIHPEGAPAILVESVHPMAPANGRQLPDWRTDLYAEPPATPDGPVRVLAGDLNSTLDHAPLRALIDTGYVDAADAVGTGLVGTWGPYDGDLIPPVTIDHVLVDRRIEVRRVSVHRLPGSDHRPVLAELRLPSGRA